MKSLLAKLAKYLGLAAGAAVVALAVAVVGARLLFAQLPGYGEELTAWIADELGLVVGFERIDVRFGLAGPEIRFAEATVAAEVAADPFLNARRAAVTIDAWALLTAREGFVKRLTLEQTRMTILRDAEGRYELQGAPLAANGDRLLTVLPERVELALADAAVVYRDEASAREWAFTNVELSLVRVPGRVRLSAEGDPSGRLAAHAALTLEGAVAGGGAALEAWRLDLYLRETDLAALAALVPAADLPAVRGRGDASLMLESAPSGLARAAARVALTGVALPDLADPERWTYDRIGLEAEWTRGAGRDWTLALDNVAVARGGRPWAPGGNSVLRRTAADDGTARWMLTSDFVRLEDLRPFLLLLPPSDGVRRWLDADVRGDAEDLSVSLTGAGAALEYDVSGRFRRLGFAGNERVPGLDGLSGELRADARSGRIRLASASVELDWPQVFRGPVDIDDVNGVVVWRQGRDALRVVSDDLALSLAGGEARSSLELAFPFGGGPPRADIEATLSRADLVAVKDWLPARMMPAPAVDWYDSAVRGGVARDVELELYGPLTAFPFDAEEGQLRVTADIADAELEFVPAWPRARGVAGRVEFVNAAFAARGSGRVLGNATRELTVAIDDLRDPTLRLATVTEGPLADVLGFIRGAPLIARELGPELARLRVHAGTGRVELDLALPLRDFSDYGLTAALDIGRGDLAVDGFAPHVSEVSGRLRLDGRTLESDALEGVFLDGPVTIRVRAAEQAGYRSALSVEGESTIDALRRELDLPFAERVAGQTPWRGELLIPAPAAAPPRPFRVRIDSNLTGVASRFPPPLHKAPDEPLNLGLELDFAAGGLAVRGNLGASSRFALSYAALGGGFELARGAIRFGGDAPVLPEPEGLTVSGTLPRLDLSEWLALSSRFTDPSGASLLLSADLELAELFVLDQQLGLSRFRLAREPEHWRLELDSEAVAGSIAVPRGATAGRNQIEADMRRLYLSAGGLGSQFDAIDPRELPGLTLHADAFALGMRELGQLDAEIRPDPLGLRLVSLASRHGEMHVDASGSWLMGVDGPRTRLVVNLSSTRLSSTLEKLGFDPVVEGELADLTARVEWPGRPSTRWMDHVDGEVSVRVERGSLLDIEPGAGRVLGLMSILALPRRLALDFRDVFNKGFVFDEITGDFAVLDGNAYTDNLKLTSPAAEIGVVGRTGLRDRDYEQQAVVTSEPGNMLPTVGGLIGGPGVGAALLIFTRIFKEPLKGIGRAVYCITGTWSAPEVERLEPSELERGGLCAALPPVASSGGSP